MEQLYDSMTDQQKVLFKQLQLAGLGIVIGIFGFFAKHKALMIIGVGVLVFGIVRAVVLKKFIDQIKEDE